MSIQDKIKALRERKKTVLMAAVFGTAPIMAQTMSDAKQDIVSTSVTQTISSQAKQYHKIVEIYSLDEMYKANRAEYHADIDAIVYSQFRMKDADKNEKRIINAYNAGSYSAEHEAHEQQHRAFHLAGISTQIKDGSCVLTPADVVRANILEEILCKKAENKNRPMSEIITEFKQDGHEKFYTEHYRSETKKTSILSALIAEDKCPEKINKDFEEITKYKHIDDNHYASLCVSTDKKYQVWELFHNDGYIVRDSNIINKSPVKIGTLLDKDGNEVKKQNGDIIHTQPIMRSNGYIVGFSMDNIDKETQGYEFTKARSNFNNLCQEYMDFVNLNQDDRMSLMNYINTDLDLSNYNQSDYEISEIKEMYKGITLEEQQAKHKNNYQSVAELNKQKAVQEKLPNLIPVDSPSASKSGKINTTAFYQGK